MDLLFKNLNKSQNIKIMEDKEDKEEKNHSEKNDIKKKKTSTDSVKKYIEKNKDKLKEKKICDVCMGTYTHFNLYCHRKTKRHLMFMEKLNNKS